MPNEAELNKFLKKLEPFLSRMTYPIQNFEQLANFLGGMQEPIRWQARSIKVWQIRKILPGYLFPIESQEDLLVKAVNLELLRPGNKLVSSQMGKEIEPSSDRKSPSKDVDEPEFRSKFKGQMGGPSIFRGKRGS